VLDRHGILFIDDEVICGFGRTGKPFGAETMGIRPTTMSVAKAVSSAYLPISAVLIPEWMYEPFIEQSGEVGTFGHGFTYSGHPVCAAVALRNLELMEERDVFAHAARVSETFQERLASFAEHPLVGDVRGAGYFLALELVRDASTGESFSKQESEEVLRGFLSPRLYDAGLVCRADDRGDPVIQLSPPLVAGDAELDEIESILRTVLTEASEKYCPQGSSALRDRRDPLVRGA
jgi:adenosylmethionine-8-amino-7-oxononanoate aminotransferase